ncbi:hypothetical protein DL93DRAFT_2092401 [Clavulina sp. PMI_390]|nr:hypothetical protein DL93DRAFT_2092401 [Clavulina sp. PMI_390]
MFAKYLVAGLAIASAAHAQLVLGASSVPADSTTATPGSTVSSSSPAATSTSSPSTTDTSSPSSTPAPGPTSMPAYPSYEYTSAMPYSVMTGGGYKSLDCGYGYVKDSSGNCKPESWYSYTNNGCYAQTTIIINSNGGYNYNTYCPYNGGGSTKTVTQTMTETMTSVSTVKETVTVTQTMTDTQTQTKTDVQIQTYTKIEPTTRIWTSTEIIDNTKTVEQTFTATETKTNVYTSSVTQTATATVTDFMTMTNTVTKLVPTTYVSTYVSTEVIDNAEAKQVDVIHARATSRRAPINKLPEQILAEIFEWCCLSIDWKHLSPEPRRVNLLGVCHWWFVVLTNCASIWRHIHIPSGFYWLDPETVSMTRLRLERAKGAKITLSVYLFRNVSDEARDPTPSHPLDSLLAQSFPRCEKLEISYLSTRTGHSFIPLPPSELPNMASLSILWVRDRDVPRKTAPPALFPSHAAYQKLRELSLSIKTRTAFTEANIYADLFGLKTVDVSAITCLNIDFDSVPDGTWDILEHFVNLSKLGLRRIGAWQPWPHDNVHGSSGVTSQPIVLASLRTANIDYVPYFASLVRLKASYLEELVTRGPLESKERVHEEVLQESLTKGLFSLAPPSLLVTLRIVRRSNHCIPPEHWDNFFAVQKRLEILECACTHVFVERIHSVPEAFPRLRLLHLRAKSAFDKNWTTDLPIEDAQLLAYQIETIRPSVSAELPEDLPGLRVLVELDEGRDLLPLPDDLPLSRFRVMPYNKSWSIHPVWA